MKALSFLFLMLSLNAFSAEIVILKSPTLVICTAVSMDGCGSHLRADEKMYSIDYKYVSDILGDIANTRDAEIITVKTTEVIGVVENPTSRVPTIKIIKILK